MIVRSRPIFWTVAAATLTIYAVMLVWSMPFITGEADGQTVFDMRPGGYTFEEARTFLRALSPEGAEFYAAVQHRLDTAYPALLALTLGWSIHLLTPKGWGVARLVLPAIALPGMVFDYWENIDVAGMLKAGPDGVTPAMVAAASFHSQVKAASTTVAMSLLLILLMVWATRRWRKTGNRV